MYIWSTTHPLHGPWSGGTVAVHPPPPPLKALPVLPSTATPKRRYPHVMPRNAAFTSLRLAQLSRRAGRTSSRPGLVSLTFPESTCTRLLRKTSSCPHTKHALRSLQKCPTCCLRSRRRRCSSGVHRESVRFKHPCPPGTIPGTTPAHPFHISPPAAACSSCTPQRRIADPNPATLFPTPRRKRPRRFSPSLPQRPAPSRQLPPLIVNVVHLLQPPLGLLAWSVRRVDAQRLALPPAHLPQLVLSFLHLPLVALQGGLQHLLEEHHLQGKEGRGAGPGQCGHWSKGLVGTHMPAEGAAVCALPASRAASLGSKACVCAAALPSPSRPISLSRCVVGSHRSKSSTGRS